MTTLDKFHQENENIKTKIKKIDNQIRQLNSKKRISKQASHKHKDLDDIENRIKSFMRDKHELLKRQKKIAQNEKKFQEKQVKEKLAKEKKEKKSQPKEK